MFGNRFSGFGNGAYAGGTGFKGGAVGTSWKQTQKRNAKKKKATRKLKKKKKKREQKSVVTIIGKKPFAPRTQTITKAFYNAPLGITPCCANEDTGKGMAVKSSKVLTIVPGARFMSINGKDVSNKDYRLARKLIKEALNDVSQENPLEITFEQKSRNIKDLLNQLKDDRFDVMAKHLDKVISKVVMDFLGPDQIDRTQIWIKQTCRPCGGTKWRQHATIFYSKWPLTQVLQDAHKRGGINEFYTSKDGSFPEGVAPFEMKISKDTGTQIKQCHNKKGKEDRRWKVQNLIDARVKVLNQSKKMFEDKEFEAEELEIDAQFREKTGEEYVLGRETTVESLHESFWTAQGGLSLEKALRFGNLTPSILG